MSDLNELLDQLRKLDTERVNPDTVDIDRLSSLEIVRKTSNQDNSVAATVAKVLEPISQAAEIFAETLAQDGRVFYIGAGTSGRLGVLDAAECPPTFGTDPSQIIGVIAGGKEALVLSREGVEDDEVAAVEDLKRHKLSAGDFLIGLTASRRTPYTLAGLKYGQSLGCRTALIVCNRGIVLPVTPDILIELSVGPEVITGSTRMKSGTAQKMTLNMISTTAMILLGKTYGNLMVDLQSRSDKLAARSRRILMELLGVTLMEAEKLLSESGGSVKLAITMGKLNCDKETAIARLNQVDGFISRLK
ncbi:MAG: N-acetylmuramic acid 6-phosphate etherase [Candidatus Zixiibacteriota bacterium]|nr:MAG: N-acetylmuramic acid 6-phosphate etherase [candidate division Zixibacteria bacterium]